MRSPYDIIQTARITEKGTSLNEIGQYLFMVDRKATKIEIKQAVETIFKKKVVRVNTIQVKGKFKKARTGHPGRQNHTKKAIVTLKPGEKLELI